jgi:ATP-dependent helicase/nuclease subunit A
MAEEFHESKSDVATAPAGGQRRPPTRQQQAAIDTKHVSVVLSAGAGCGKTTVLTDRFLSHLEPGQGAVELSSLVAITFTERAARQMRERIRKQCLDKLRSVPPGEAEHWLGIVRSLDSARISTIHAFCSSLLRAHAVDAAIDPKFTLLDETLSGSFLQQSIEGGLHRQLAADDSDAAELVFEFGLNRMQALLANLISQRYRIEPADWERLTGRELAVMWDHRWHKEVVPRLQREAAESAVVCTTIELLRRHVPRNAVMRERCEILLAQLPQLAADGDPRERLETIRSNARVQGGGTKKDWEHEDVYAEVKDALADVRALIERLQKQLEYDPEHLIRGAEIALCALRAAVRVGAHYDEQKREAGLVDFDDLLLLARNLLRDHEDVRRRVSAGIALLMVDEFQDTDPIQDDIVRMLCGDRLLTGRLFVVGDAKQSIYRFRRAEPRVFHRLREEIADEGRLPLTTNFRSQPEILNFVNAVFDGALGDSYEPLKSFDKQETEPPVIEFMFATAPADEAGTGEESDQSAATRRRREGDWIARRLAQLLADGVPRVRERDEQTGEPRLRAVRRKDIVILFRAMTDVRYYEESLRKHGINYYVVGGRAFFAQQEIFDCLNLCRYLDDVDDEVSLIGVLRSPFFSLSDDAIVALGSAPTAALTERPPPYLTEEQHAQIRFAGQTLAELRAAKDTLPIAQLLALAVERTGYDASLLTEFLGTRKLANLRKLMELARQFDESGLFTLADFVDRLRDAVADETYEPLAATHPESSDVVRLMSIHQSKGLEFPVVVIADMDRQSQDQTPIGCFDPVLGPLVPLPAKFGQQRDQPALVMYRLQEREAGLAEARRLLYVAMTRAADLLILSANVKQAGRPINPWLKLVGERFDLGSGQPRQAPATGGVSVLARYSGRLPGIRVHQGPPESTARARRDDRTGTEIPLNGLRELLDRAEPAQLPATLKVFSADRSARSRFSVSEIENLDRQLRAGQSTDEAFEDPDDEHALADSAAAATTGAGSAAIQIGILAHRVLEKVDFQKPQDIAALVTSVCGSSGTGVGESVQAAVVACVANVVASPLCSELAAARRVFREIDFLLRLPSPDQSRATGILISGTIDCLFESARGEWLVLDYKTGVRDGSTSDAAVLADYEIQLGMYALAVREFLKQLPDRIELVFVRNGLARVAFEAGAERLTDVTTRVHRAVAAWRSASD